MIILQPSRTIATVDSTERNVNKKFANQQTNMNLSQSASRTTTTNMIAMTRCCTKSNFSSSSTTSSRRRRPPSSAMDNYQLSSLFKFMSSSNTLATYILLAVILYSSTFCMAQHSGE